MSRRLAFVVEDESIHAARVTRILRKAGFESIVAQTALAAREAVGDLIGLVDLVVLDRRLPKDAESEPMDDTGDSLREELLGVLSDVPFVVLTAHADIEHVQDSTSERGWVSLSHEIVLDRVKVFQKIQYLRFDEYIQKIAAGLNRLEEIDVNAAGGVGADVDIYRRLLRKVASAHDGVSISARQMGGGSTASVVYLCEVRSQFGLNARLVVKIGVPKGPRRAHGLHALFPATNIAAPGDIISGMCAGRRGEVLQLASKDAEPLFSVLSNDEAQAVDAVNAIARLSADCLTYTSQSVTLEEFISPLIGWKDLEFALRCESLPKPNRRAWVSTEFAEQHGDLHGGNILVASGVPMLIDFDSEARGSRLLDPLTLFLSSLFHPTSPLVALDWPPPTGFSKLSDIVNDETCPKPSWFGAVWAWVDSFDYGEREMWGVVLAYAARQIPYPDIKASERLTLLATYLLKLSSERLSVL